MKVVVARRALLALAASGSMLSACTTLYTREFAVDPVQGISLQEQQQVFEAFRDFLASKGFKPSYDRGPYPDRASFVIGERRGESSRFSPLDYRDILELSYAPDSGFRLRLTRITDQMSDFSDQYLKNFVTQTETFLREATGRPVRIKSIPAGRSADRP